MQAHPTKTVETFALVAQPMTRADIPRLHHLSVGVGWTHRPEDWEAVLSLGEGIFVVDEIGRAVASAMWFPFTEGLASIGMVITAPRLQEYGTGRWLMGQILDRAGERDLMLSATNAAYRLYCSLGLTPGPTIHLHSGFATTPPDAPPLEVRPLRPEDEAEVRALDAHAFTVPRDRVMDHLRAIGQGTVLLRQGRIAGFAFCRPFGRGHVIGPVVADTQQEAIALIAPHIRAHPGGFLRLDTRETEGPLRDYLTACGMKLQEMATSMSRGTERFSQRHPRIFGLFSQALG
ncbi:GNAT family N-acetyltransferase [Paenirhodobacter sp.]|uniref:GNAT family N-acetyltransferase n=1 Tax=Paenirhodobacter sp. TaxID=1965326 RepID=UPI003B3CE12C